MRHRSLPLLTAAFLAAFLPFSSAHAARDAAFMAPSAAVSSGAGARSDEAISIEPKSEIDLGETGINVGRRTTLFFVNTTSLPVDLVGVSANGDSTVRSEVVSDDCTKEGKIASASRCSVTVEVTPTGVGPWTAEVLLTHKGAGRIAKARLSGKTTGGTSADKKDQGLSLSSKDVKPVDFGDVEPAGGKAVRTALMVNDSNEPLTILSVEVIAPENGLEKLEQGCTPDMDLKIGESCPVTLLWKPDHKGQISTDLIIRHSGRLGFAVIPIRGTAKEAPGSKNADGSDTKASKNGSGSSSGNGGSSSGNGKPPLSPTADDLEKMISGKVPPITADSLPASATGGGFSGGGDSSDGAFHLIGTVGNRALIYKPDGQTAVVGVGDEISYGNGKTVKLTNVMPKQAEIFISGKKKILPLEAVSSLTSKAVAAKESERAMAPLNTSKGDSQKQPTNAVPLGR